MCADFSIYNHLSVNYANITLKMAFIVVMLGRYKYSTTSVHVMDTYLFCWWQELLQAVIFALWLWIELLVFINLWLKNTTYLFIGCGIHCQSRNTLQGVSTLSTKTETFKWYDGEQWVVVPVKQYSFSVVLYGHLKVVWLGLLEMLFGHPKFKVNCFIVQLHD